MWTYDFQPIPNPDLPAGIVVSRPNPEMSIGTAVHKGAEILLKAGSMEKANLSEAVSAALSEYDTIWAPTLAEEESRSTSLLPWLSNAIEEGRALVEALTCVFYYHPQGLNSIFSTCEVLAIETEIAIPLPGEPPMVLMSRPDLIVRSNLDGRIYSIDIKTARQWDERSESAAAVDDQSIAQAVAVEFLFGEESAGEIRLNLLKGSKKFDATLNCYINNSPLIKPYGMFNEFISSQTGVTESNWSYVPSKFFQCDAPHTIKGRRCSGGKNHKLGDEWTQVNLWLQGPGAISDWVATFATDYPEEFQSTLKLSNPIWQSRAIRDQWMRQVVATESRALEARSLGLTPDIMDAYFPQNRSHCDYPYKCGAYVLCHKINQPLTQSTLEAFGFTARTPHHTFEGVVTDE